MKDRKHTNMPPPSDRTGGPNPVELPENLQRRALHRYVIFRHGSNAANQSMTPVRAIWIVEATDWRAAVAAAEKIHHCYNNQHLTARHVRLCKMADVENALRQMVLIEVGRNTHETALDAIRAALGARGIKDYAGGYAVYRDREQNDGQGRDWADYHGPVHPADANPRLVSSLQDAATSLEAVRADSSMGGFRYGRVAIRPIRSSFHHGSEHREPGKPEDEIMLAEICKRGFRSL